MMPKKIACLLGSTGKTESFYERGRIVIYQKDKGKWKIIDVKEHQPEEIDSIKDLHQEMKSVIDFLDGCKIFVAYNVVGIPFYMLEKAKCSIWECEGQPEYFLDYILEKEEENSEDLAPPNKILLDQYKPKEFEKGFYYLSLKEIQEQDIGLTTKQILLPFIKKGDFRSIEIRCNHIPPWLDTEIVAQGLIKDLQTMAKNDVKLVITKE